MSSNDKRGTRSKSSQETAAYMRRLMASVVLRRRVPGTVGLWSPSAVSVCSTTSRTAVGELLRWPGVSRAHWACRLTANHLSYTQ